MSSISETLRQQVSAESGYCCEYCRTCRRIIGMPLVIVHIIPQIKGGGDEQYCLKSSLPFLIFFCRLFI